MRRRVIRRENRPAIRLGSTLHGGDGRVADDAGAPVQPVALEERIGRHVLAEAGRRRRTALELGSMMRPSTVRREVLAKAPTELAKIECVSVRLCEQRFSLHKM